MAYLFSKKVFGHESITEIVNYIDKNVRMSIIIAAGHEDKINDCFLKINEGMKHRFPNNFGLIDYTSIDLSNILFFNIEKLFYKLVLTQSQIDYIVKVIDKLNSFAPLHGSVKLFNNQAVDMLNLSNELIRDLIQVTIK